MENFIKTDPTNKNIDIDSVFTNDKYQVYLRKRQHGWVWLSIKRLDQEVIHDWRELQKIKNMICGEEFEALELYPAESRLVDTSNQFHLWVMPKGEQFPFGYGNRLVIDGHDKSDDVGSKQRKFEDKPTDCKTIKEVIKNE